MTPEVSFFDTSGVALLRLNDSSDAAPAEVDWWEMLLHAEPWVWLCGGLLVLLLLQTVRLWWTRNAGARRIARHKKLGERGERHARRLLEEHGYRIVSSQASGSYDLLVDDQVETIRLRADFLVESPAPRISLFRGLGRRQSGYDEEPARFVAEVKSGLESGKITGRATRRQLLEYLLAFDVAGVLLVDTARSRISVVQFPERS